MITVSTLTTGWHYFVDVLGGLTISILSLAVSNYLLAAGPTRHRHLPNLLVTSPVEQE
jgi:membrane-associated phospholipid phosphatase